MWPYLTAALIVSVKSLGLSTAAIEFPETESPMFDVDNGMESNRGGPLTTFIMTLPMIVVPTIAMLKPADNGAGLVSSLLSAGQSPSSAEVSADNAPEFPDAAGDVEAMFFEEGSDAPEFAAAPGESLVDDFDAIFGAEFDTPPIDQPDPSPSSADTRAPPTIDAGRLHAELQNMGVVKTLWFSPGDQRSGFVAFFADTSGNGPVQYRFEAIAETRDEALQDVVMQVRHWQGTQR